MRRMEIVRGIRHAALSCGFVLALIGTPQAADKVPAGVLEALGTGRPQELILLLDDLDIETEAGLRRRKAGLAYDDESILGFKANGYRMLKQRVQAELGPGEADLLAEYSHLPMLFVRLRTRAALERILRRPDVKAVYENRPIYPLLAYSLPFIRQPAVASRGMTGSGVAVAVIDTGIDYTLADFGSCTAPGVPAGCKVAASVDVTGNGVTLNTDPHGHGTNVAGIAVGVAPGSRIAAVNVFSGGTSTSAWLIDGINWAIANKAAHDITAMNMSLGDGGNYGQPCGNSQTNPFVTPVNNARSAGILPVAASGNSGLAGGMSNPACVPGVVSVGAVYDADWGGPFTWSSGCTDASSGPDRIPCFSDSASFLTMLAPGAFVTAAGIQLAGTSQASPHVAGAVAVLRSAFPSETLDQTVARLTAGGVPVTDPRNGITKPRLDLEAAAGPPVAVPALSFRGTAAAGLTLVLLLLVGGPGRRGGRKDPL